MAQLLAREGHDVRSLPETRGRGRTPDLLVCGRGVEVKAWDPLEVRRGRPPTSRSVLNKLLDGGDQAPAVVLFGRGSGVSPATVRRGLALYTGHPAGFKVTSARVLGDGFDLGWARLAPTGRDLLSSPGRAVPADRGRGARRPRLVLPAGSATDRAGPGLGL